MKSGITTSLQQRLTWHVGLGTLAFALVGGALAFVIDYQLYTDRLDGARQDMIKVIAPQVALVLDAGNQDDAQALVQGVVNVKPVAFASIENLDGPIARFSRSEGELSATTELHRYPVVSQHDGKTLVGHFSVGFDRGELNRRAIIGALIHVLMLLVQLVVSVSLALWTFRRLVGEPLSNISRQVLNLRPGQSERFAMLPGHESDEIGQLIISANHLLVTAEQATAKERISNERVEQTVAEYEEIYQSSRVGIMVLNPQGKLVNKNRVLLSSIVGVHFDGGHVTESDDFIQAIFVQPERAWALVAEAHTSRLTAGADLQLRVANGEERWAYCIFSVSTDRNGQISLIEGILYDISEQRRRAQDGMRSTGIDPLTGLADAEHTQIVLDRAIRHAADDHVAVALILIEIDPYPELLKQYGNEGVQALMQEIAIRLRDRIRRASDMVARIEPSRFAVIAYDCGDKESAQSIANDLLEDLARPIHVSDDLPEHSLALRMAICLYPEDAETRGSLFQCALRQLAAVPSYRD